MSGPAHFGACPQLLAAGFGPLVHGLAIRPVRAAMSLQPFPAFPGSIAKSFTSDLSALATRFRPSSPGFCPVVPIGGRQCRDAQQQECQQ